MMFKIEYLNIARRHKTLKINKYKLHGQSYAAYNSAGRNAI